MSDITLFKQAGATLPDYIRADADDFTRKMAGAPTGKSISIEGGVWRMIVGGEEIAKNEDRAMNFVVVNGSPNVSRVFYAGKYVKGEAAGPACFSADGKAPDPTAATPQSSACATCPQNVEGSGEGTSRACRYFQRIAVVLEGDISGNVYRLQLPSKSIFGKPVGDKMPFQAYARFLAGHGVPMKGVVTEARFDTSQSVPVLNFRAVRPLTREEWDASISQGASDDAQQAIETKFTNATKSSPPAALPSTFTPATTAHIEEPTKRDTKKAEPAVPAKDLQAIVAKWSSDDDDQ